MHHYSAARKVVDTAVVGEVMRNLTSWEDVDASRVAFAVGNTLFAAVVRATLLPEAVQITPFLPTHPRATSLSSIPDLLTLFFRSPRPVRFPLQFIGRKAFLLLWLAFLAAFLATPVRSGQFSEWLAGLQLADALATAKDFAGDMLAMLRERVAAARGGMGGGMSGGVGGDDGAY